MVSRDLPAATGLPGSILRNLCRLTRRAIHARRARSGGRWKCQGASKPVCGPHGSSSQHQAEARWKEVQEANPNFVHLFSFLVLEHRMGQ